MKKFTVLAMVAAVLMAGAAFARTDHRLTIQPNATFTFGGAGAVAGTAIGPTTTNNDDSCDIGTAPAATLLLPYFEVDFKSAQGAARTTLFTITNVSNLPQIVHVVIWTDWSFPALDFNIFLTGYDVQAINLYDIFARGVIAPPSGTTSDSIGTETQIAEAASTPAAANPLITLTNCTNLPGPIPPALLADLQAIFTAGVGSGSGIPCSVRVGGTHANAIGYITADVNANCNTSLPNVSTYFTTNILFDNVLIGDYENVQPNPAVVNAAGGSPMVSIRAVPEGGTAGSNPFTNLPFTFYDRYTVGIAAPFDRAADRRQPLPNTFAARYISGGTGSFNTNYQIWREGYTVGGCTTGATGAINNSSMTIAELIRFDEHENSTSITGSTIISPAPPGSGLPETSSSPLSGGVFPVMPSAAGDVAGWTYLNLNNNGIFGATFATFSRLTAVGVRTAFNGTTVNSTNRPSQNWVTVNMQAESRFSVLFDAAWLGNGCSPSPGVNPAIGIGPQGGVLVCPAPLAPSAGCAPAPLGNAGTNTNPF